MNNPNDIFFSSLCVCLWFVIALWCLQKSFPQRRGKKPSVKKKQNTKYFSLFECKLKTTKISVCALPGDSCGHLTAFSLFFPSYSMLISLQVNELCLIFSLSLSFSRSLNVSFRWIFAVKLLTLKMWIYLIILFIISSLRLAVVNKWIILMTIWVKCVLTLCSFRKSYA